jgi:hypothetical protein
LDLGESVTLIKDWFLSRSGSIKAVGLIQFWYVAQTGGKKDKGGEGSESSVATV